jgi:hypothetical protein
MKELLSLQGDTGSAIFSIDSFSLILGSFEMFLFSKGNGFATRGPDEEQDACLGSSRNPCISFFYCENVVHQ